MSALTAIRRRRAGHIHLPMVLQFWLLAFMVGLLIGAGHLLDGPSDDQAAQDVAASVRDARWAAAQQARMEAAARRACNNQGGYYFTGPGTVQCTTTGGRPTAVAEVRP